MEPVHFIKFEKKIFKVLKFVKKWSNLQDCYGYTPLHVAAATIRVSVPEKIRICRFLLSKGADPEMENKYRQTATDFEFWETNKSEIEGKHENDQNVNENENSNLNDDQWSLFSNKRIWYWNHTFFGVFFYSMLFNLYLE